MKKRKVSIISKLEKSLPRERLKRAQTEAKETIFRIRLAQLREMQGRKQDDNSNFSQASISKIENRKDLKLSTLRNYLHSIGMELEITVRPKGARNAKKDVVLLKD